MSQHAWTAGRTGAPGAARALGEALSSGAGVTLRQPALLPSSAAGSRAGAPASVSSRARPRGLGPASLSRGVWGTSVHGDPLPSPALMSMGLCHFPLKGLPSSQRRTLGTGAAWKGRREGWKAGFGQRASVCTNGETLAAPPHHSIKRKRSDSDPCHAATHHYEKGL